MAEPTRLNVRWADVEERCRVIAATWWRQRRALLGVYGPPRGGCVPAALVAQLLDLPVLDQWWAGCILVVDDLVDSGRTLQPFADIGLRVDAMFRKSWSPAQLAPSARDVGDAWIVLPWEHDEVPALDAAVRLLQAVGGDTTRPDVDELASMLADRAAQLAAGPSPS